MPTAVVNDAWGLPSTVPVAVNPLADTVGVEMSSENSSPEAR